MITASKTTTVPAPNAVRQWTPRAPVARPTVSPFPRAVPATEVVESRPAPVPADPAPDTFGADLAREMIELRGYALWLCNSGSLADDLIQDTLLRAWAARDRFQPGTNLKAWCTTILRNVFFSYKRRSWRSQPLPDDVVDELTSESEISGHRLDLLALRNAIALLPQDQRQALLLVGAGGQSYIEAAEVCDCAVGTVKSRVSRARLRLAALMAENRAGFNSDSSLGAGDTLDDLMDQVSRLKARGGRVRTREDASMNRQAVLSESV